MGGHNWLLIDDLLREDCYWVEQGRLLAGSHPAPDSLFGSEHKLRNLIAAGISCFLDLPTQQEAPAYGKLAQTIATETGRGPLRYLQMPLTEHKVPTIEEMEWILAKLDEALSDGLCTFVHCHYGVGRTGLVVGCWLIRHNVATREDVLQHIARLRTGLDSPWRSPHTATQREWIPVWASSK
jgi:protein-tyrosine phosphatase